MKNKMNRNAHKVKLIQVIGEYIKSVTSVESKKISKSIKKASKLVAKAIAKEISAIKALRPVKEKIVVTKKPVKKQLQPKAIKRMPLSRVVRKINKTVPVKNSSKKQMAIFIGHDGHDKTGKEL